MFRTNPTCFRYYSQIFVNKNISSLSGPRDAVGGSGHPVRWLFADPMAPWCAWDEWAGPCCPCFCQHSCFLSLCILSFPPKILLEDRSLLKREKEKMLVTVDQLSLLALVGGIRSWVCYLYLWSKSLHCVLALEPFLSFKISSFRH